MPRPIRMKKKKTEYVLCIMVRILCKRNKLASIFSKGSFDRSNNPVDMRQINKRKIIKCNTYINVETHILERVRVPTCRRGAPTCRTGSEIEREQEYMRHP